MSGSGENDDDNEQQGLVTKWGLALSAERLAELEAEMNAPAQGNFEIEKILSEAATAELPSKEREKIERTQRAEEAARFFDDLVKPDTVPDLNKYARYWHEFDDAKKYSFTPEQLTRILTHTAAKIDTTNDMALKEKLLNEVMFRFSSWEETAVKKIRNFSQFDLAGCMWAYRKLNLNPRDPFLQQFYKHAKPEDILCGDPNVRSDPNDVNFVRSIVSLAVVGLKPSKSFMDAWLEKSLRHIKNFSATQLAFSLWAYARLGEEPDKKFLNKWEARFYKLLRHKPEAFRPRDFANIMGACQALNAILGDKHYKSIAGKANTKIDDSLCTKAEKRQAGYARMWFDLAGPEQYFPAPNETTSHLETSLREAFNAAGLFEDPDTQPVKLLGYKPDLHFNVHGQRVFIEVDGAPHFLYEINELTGEIQPAGFTGRTLSMSALVKKFAPDAVILRLPWPLVERTLNQEPQRQKEILISLLESAEKAGPGAYHARLSAPLPPTEPMSENPHLRTLNLAA